MAQHLLIGRCDLQTSLLSGRRSTTLVAMLWLSAVAASGAADWPQWRGPDGQGHSAAQGPPLQWSETSHVAWKTAIPGRGWSSPIVAGDLVWLTTAVETPASAADTERRLKANTGNQPLTLLERVELRAVAIDRKSGEVRHNVLLLAITEPQWVHRLNSYASPTPVWEAGLLYCQFGTFGTVCLDTRGPRIVWTNNELHTMHENGPGGSPVLVGNTLAFHLDGSDSQSIAALDKRTGQVLWKTERSGEMHREPQLRKSYGTPLVLEVNGQSQIISPASNWVYGYDPVTGKELWRLPYGELGFSLTPRPVAGHGMFYMATGFGKAQLLAVKYDTGVPQVAWRYQRGSPTMPSPLLVGNDLYIISDNGILTCLDALTGAERYRERLSGNFSSSPWFAEGRIYVSNREGATYVIAAGPQFQLLAENRLAEGAFASPAAVDGAIYWRGEHHLYCLQSTRN